MVLCCRAAAERMLDCTAAQTRPFSCTELLECAVFKCRRRNYRARAQKLSTVCRDKFCCPMGREMGIRTWLGFVYVKIVIINVNCNNNSVIIPRGLGEWQAEQRRVWSMQV